MAHCSQELTEVGLGQKWGKRKGKLLPVLIANSNFCSCKTFWKGDLFLQNWTTSALSLWKGNLPNSPHSFDTRLNIFDICTVVAPDDLRSHGLGPSSAGALPQRAPGHKLTATALPNLAHGWNPQASLSPLVGPPFPNVRVRGDAFQDVWKVSELVRQDSSKFL